MTDKVKGAMIGCGAISKSHIGSMQTAGIEVAALCDINEEGAQGRNEEFCEGKAKVYTDYTEMLKDESISVVGIGTPPFLHRDQTVESLQAGKYVYCEKPVSFTLNEFKEILETEKSTGKHAYYTPCRYRAGDAQTIKEYVQNKKLGDVYWIDTKHLRGRGRPGVDGTNTSRWFADSSKAILGISGDMGMYMIDRALDTAAWPEVVSVSASTFKGFPHDMPDGLAYDVEENMLLTIKTPGKLTLTFEMANVIMYENGTVNVFDVFGTEGGMRTNNWTPGLRYITRDDNGEYKEEDLSKDGEKIKGDVTVYGEIAAEAQGGERVKAGTNSDQMYLIHNILQSAFLSSQEKCDIKPKDVDPSAQIFIAP